MNRRLCIALMIIMTFSSSGFAYAMNMEPLAYDENKAESYRNNAYESEDIRSGRYTIVRIHDPSRDKTFSNWYNNGTEAASTKKATNIYAAYYRVYQKNVGTGQMNYLYYEYHVTYHWYTRNLTSQSWTDHGTKSGTLRHQLTSIVDLLALWT